MDERPDGWREPRLSALRTAAIVVVLVLLAWLVVFEPGPNDLSAIGTLIGFLAVALGYGGIQLAKGRK